MPMTTAVPRSGCSITSPIGNRRDQERECDVGQLRLCLTVATFSEEHRQAHRERHLHELRWLDREPTRQLDPRLRPVYLSSHDEDGDEPDHRCDVDERGVCAQRPIVEEHRGEPEAKADGQVEQMALEVRLRILTR